MKKLFVSIALICFRLSMFWKKHFGHEWTVDEILKREV